MLVFSTRSNIRGWLRMMMDTLTYSCHLLLECHSLQFKKSPPKVPYKAIALAVFLFLVGTLLITFGGLLLAGTIVVEHPDRTIPVIIIGILVFLPGFYHLRIAYYAAKGYRGYSYDDIPDFGD
uniref:transmembrane protein 230-like isoform X1 n=1 Tax=Doryrhamphus excisus TaxID=161450 RepID=UPI0025AE8C4C|nr:transmembrane protein 230-like isoform X1 [Doryrhamphus excisus]